MRSRIFVAAVLLACGMAFAAPSPQTPLPSSGIQQFVEPLPQLNLGNGASGITTIIAKQTSASAPLQLSMCEFQAHVITLADGTQPATWVWGYVPGATCPMSTQDSYLGPVLVSYRGTPTHVRFTNQLGTVRDTHVLAWKYSTDQTIHWADPLGAEQNACAMMSDLVPSPGSACSVNYGQAPWSGTFEETWNPAPIPSVPHLHGGEVPPAIDGGPDAWFTSDGSMHGHDYYSNPNAAVRGNEVVYSYPNTQQAAPVWFHDHTLGATRLNVYAGLAGVDYIVDPNQTLPPTLPGVASVVPLIIQDRMFDTDGQLYFPADKYALNPEHPYWVPEFIGDTILVNGKAWPFFNAQPKRYRMLILNGSNARSYDLKLTRAGGAAGPPLWVIANDGGYLDAPQSVDSLLVMPGERYEVIIDFAAAAGQTLLLENSAPAPLPSGDPVDPTTTGRVMQFRISSAHVVDTSYDPASGQPLRAGSQKIVRLTDASTGAMAPNVPVALTRELTLNEVAIDEARDSIDPVTGQEVEYEGGPFEVLVNNTKWSGTARRDFRANTIGGMTEYLSELPSEGTTEVWEIVNTTADSHPIHLHLVQFQVLNRQAYDEDGYYAAYSAAFPGGAYVPAYGPPLDYNKGVKRRGKPLYGGNPDVTPYLEGPVLPPRSQEIGWKDTVMVPPGMVTRFVVRWAPTDLPAGAVGGYPFSPGDGAADGSGSHSYVWHCHIIDHEDNEMMRPDVVIPDPSFTRTVVKGRDY